MSARPWLALVALAACHVRTTLPITRPGESHDVVHPGAVRALPATIMIAPDGRLRFVEPLRCAADVFVDVEHVETVRVRPNLALLVVGIVATAGGALAAVRGLAVGSTPTELAGAGGLAIGLPFLIGPLYGNGDTDRDLGVTQERKGAAEVACGERGLVARSASIKAGRFEAFGAVDGEGEFELSPFAFVDAFEPGAQPPLDLTAQLTGDQGVTTVEAVLDDDALAKARDGFLTASKIDTRIEPLRKVPNLVAGAIKVSSLDDGTRRMLRVVLPLRNDGPGDAWQLRAVIAAAEPEVDGRIAYIGHLGKGESQDVELRVPLTAAAAHDLEGDEIDLAIQLREGNGAAPVDPVRFHGRVLAGIPR
jgi:hypothetical protein